MKKKRIEKAEIEIEVKREAEIKIEKGKEKERVDIEEDPSQELILIQVPAHILRGIGPGQNLIIEILVKNLIILECKGKKRGNM